MTIRRRLLVRPAVVRGLTSMGARRGDPQGRVIANPAGSGDELRASGSLLLNWAAWVTADHALAHQVLRSDDFLVTAIGKALPGPLARIEQRLRVTDHMHPLLSPSLLSVEPLEHTEGTDGFIAQLTDHIQRDPVPHAEMT